MVLKSGRKRKIPLQTKPCHNFLFFPSFAAPYKFLCHWPFPVPRHTDTDNDGSVEESHSVSHRHVLICLNLLRLSHSPILSACVLSVNLYHCIKTLVASREEDSITGDDQHTQPDKPSKPKGSTPKR